MERNDHRRSKKKKGGSNALALLGIVLLAFVILTGGWFILHRLDIAGDKMI